MDCYLVSLMKEKGQGESIFKNCLDILSSVVFLVPSNNFVLIRYRFGISNVTYITEI